MRLIDTEGEQLGIVSLQEALRKAEEEGLDLVEVAPNANPPVCRIMDYGKYKYQQQKKLQEAKKKQTQSQLKEVKLRPKIEEHDFQFKLKHIRRFLKEGSRVKVTMRFKGREIVHTDLAKSVLVRIVKEVEEISRLEKSAFMQGRIMIMILAPK